MTVSDWTVRRALERAELSPKLKQKITKTYTKTLRNHLYFVKKHQNWTLSNSKRVIFLYKSIIVCFNLDGWSWYWICDGLLNSCVQKRVKHGSGSIMV